MNIPNPQEAEYTRPLEVEVEGAPGDSEPTPAPPYQAEQPPPVAAITVPAPGRERALPRDESILYVPLAVTVGDGFKFGCGFFMAFVLALLLGFVLVAALFVLTSLLGVNLFVAR